MPITRKHVIGGSLAAGIALAAGTLIPHWEGFDPTVKHNTFDPPNVYTGGAGLTNSDLPWLKPGMTFSRDKWNALFEAALPKYVEPLRRCVRGLDTMPPHRIAALIDAAYNLGDRAVCNSTAVRLINEDKIDQGCEALGRFVTANGRYLQGLANRRNDPTWGEIEWCKRDD